MLPNPPQGLLVRNVGNGSAEISWTASAGATEYYVYISQALATGYAKILSTQYDVARIRNLPFGVTIYIKVSAVNGDGESALSAAGRDADAAADLAATSLTFTGFRLENIKDQAVFAANVRGETIAVRVLSTGALI